MKRHQNPFNRLFSSNSSSPSSQRTNEHRNKGSVILHGSGQRRQIFTIVLTSKASSLLGFRPRTKAAINGVKEGSSPSSLHRRALGTTHRYRRNGSILSPTTVSSDFFSFSHKLFPPLVCWDTHSRFFQLFEQSALIYGNYYHVQILIHRSFIPTPQQASSSLDGYPIASHLHQPCANPRRTTEEGSRLLPCVVIFLRPSFVLTRPQLPAFTAPIVLLLNIWGGKRSGVTTDPVKQMSTDV